MPTSRRAISRSIAVLERAGVWLSGAASRLAQAGTAGASWPCSRHQASHEATEARRAFQVLTAAPPHSVSRASPISSSATAASGRCSPSRGAVLPTPMA
ncbi:hypothetical protein [Nonomuraea jabiensis]|uniref:Uncharacterized protein n=1 Tax=Nonomuraea jabiensis TaxID=882448 RepID=A0A7W9LFP4_9ACTN|nr:hypothetical protein [Nonomuraea jabiensis]MBB5782099.1 hypothetical protein [Nonomuraea jabiensis]